MHSAKGMTLMEVVVTLLLTSMVLGILMSFTLVSGKWFGTIQAKKETASEYEKLKQFLQEEIRGASDVCIKAYTTGDPSTRERIDIVHQAHTSADLQDYYGRALPLQGMVFDKVKDLEVFQDGEVLEIQYQRQELLNEASDKGVTHLVACEVLTDGTHVYLLVTFRDRYNQETQATIPLFIQKKGVGKWATT